MKKWRKGTNWVLRKTATALLLSFISIATTGFIVNHYIQSVGKQFGIKLDAQPMARILGTLWKDESISSKLPVSISSSTKRKREDMPKTIPKKKSQTGNQATPSLTDKQQQELYAKVMTKLTSEQMQQLSDALKEGVTGEKFAEIEQILKSILTKQEYEQIIKIFSEDNAKKSEEPSPQATTPPKLN